MPRLNFQDSIAAYSRAARRADAIDLCAAVWPGDAPVFVCAALRQDLGCGSDYPPPQGDMALREAVAASYGGVPVSAGNVTISPGATGGLLITLAALARPGSEVILLEPGYQLSGQIIEALGLRPRRVAAWIPPNSAEGWRLDSGRVLAAIDERVSAIIVTDPDNPTGGVLTGADWRRLIDAARQGGCHLIVDRVYEHYPVDNAPISTPALLVEGVVVLSSVTKWLHAAGLRMGWVLSDSSRAAALAQTSAVLLGGVATPMQIAVATAINDMPAGYLAKEAAIARQSRRTLIAALSARGVDTWPTGGGLFLNVPAAQLGANSSVAAWRALLAMGIGSVPSAAFRSSVEAGREAFVRLSFARDARTLDNVRTPRRRSPSSLCPMPLDDLHPPAPIDMGATHE